MPLVLSHVSFQAMGGPCDVHLWLDQSADSKDIISRLKNEVFRLEQKYSRFLSTSILSKINRQELNGQPLDQETAGLFNYIEQCYELSSHMFDPTVGILQQLWNFKIAQLPDQDLLNEAKRNIGWLKVGWDGTSVSIEDGIQIDLGGVVKEFAVDRLCNLLRENDISGLVNLAGDIAVSAPPPNAESWKIAIQHPRQSGAIAEIDIVVGGLAGSGDYERYIEVAGKRYCHILRPDTGYPAENGLCSVSVLAENCLMAGTISTIAMLKGDQGIAWLNEMELPYLAFDKNLTAFGTIGV